MWRINYMCLENGDMEEDSKGNQQKSVRFANTSKASFESDLQRDSRIGESKTCCTACTIF